MATLDSLISIWNEEFNKISKSLVRYKVFQAIDGGFAAKYGARVEGSADPAAINTFLELERTRYIESDIDSIDPVTMHDIVEGVIWPTISALDNALVDHPTDPLLNSMRGVTLHQLFNGKAFRGADVAYKLSPNNLPFAKKANEALQAIRDEINSNPLEAADQKKTLSSMFKSEDAALLWYISYGRMDALGNPIQTMATLNPYLGYFLMTIGWVGGANAVAGRGIAAAIIAGKGGDGIRFPTDLPKQQVDAISSAAEIGNYGSLNATVAAIGANHKWLQEQKVKPETQDFYKKWADRFVNNPNSMVNMVVVLNEVVNINPKLHYRYSPQTKQRLTELGAAYMAGFSITVGD